MSLLFSRLVPSRATLRHASRLARSNIRASSTLTAEKNDATLTPTATTTDNGAAPFADAKDTALASNVAAEVSPAPTTVSNATATADATADATDIAPDNTGSVGVETANAVDNSSDNAADIASTTKVPPASDHAAKSKRATKVMSAPTITESPPVSTAVREVLSSPPEVPLTSATTVPSSLFPPELAAEPMSKVPDVTETKKVPIIDTLWGALIDVSLDSRLAENARKKGWEEPIAIQLSAIPPLLEGRNVVASAETGQGKTGAYALPIIQRMLVEKPATAVPNRKSVSPRAIILTPTAELTNQVAREINSLCRGLNVRAAAIYVTGEGIEDQIKRAKRAQILVATPGRLLSHIKSSKTRTEVKPIYPGLDDEATLKKRAISNHFLSLDDVEALVVDECDRLLDGHNIADVLEVKQALPVPQEDKSSGEANGIVSGLKQTIIMSATLAPSSHEFILKLAPNHQLVDLNRKMKVPKQIKQIVYEVGLIRKFGALLYLLRRKEKSNVSLMNGRILLFCRTAQQCNTISSKLQKEGYSAVPLHGEIKPMLQRKIVQRFGQAETDAGTQILVSTDIAARGLDIPNITHVVNYDVPHAPEDYVHRVGRTGRAGAPGTAITLVSKDVEDVRMESHFVTRRDERLFLEQIIKFIGGDEEEAGSRRKKTPLSEYARTGIERRKLPGVWRDAPAEPKIAPEPETQANPDESVKETTTTRPARQNPRPKISVAEKRRKQLDSIRPPTVTDYSRWKNYLSINEAKKRGVEITENDCYLLGKVNSTPRLKADDDLKRRGDKDRRRTPASKGRPAEDDQKFKRVTFDEMTRKSLSSWRLNRSTTKSKTFSRDSFEEKPARPPRRKDSIKTARDEDFYPLGEEEDYTPRRMDRRTSRVGTSSSRSSSAGWGLPSTSSSGNHHDEDFERPMRRQEGTPRSPSNDRLSRAKDDRSSRTSRSSAKTADPRRSKASSGSWSVV